MEIRQEFNPDWTSAPGDTIREILDQMGMSVAEFAERIGRARQEADDLLQGRATITLGIARRLQQAIGGSVEFWMSRDFQYRQDGARLREADNDWLDELPVGDMIRFGWLNPVPRPSEEMRVCLDFFGVTNVQEWRQHYAGLKKIVAFRKSPSFESRPAAIAAWLRRGEIEAESIKTAPWNPQRFRETLSEIRSLTQIGIQINSSQSCKHCVPPPASPWLSSVAQTAAPQAVRLVSSLPRRRC